MKVKTKKRRPTKVSPNITRLLEESTRDDLIVTPSYNDFLTTWDENYPPHVVRRIAEILATPQRDRRHAWSASGAGMCLRRQEFAFLGMPTATQYNPQQRRIFLNGTWCLGPSTKILMADLSWKFLDEVKEGDELIGFDEEHSGGKGGGRCFRAATVLANPNTYLPTMRVKTQYGETDASENHLWLVAGRGRTNVSWVRTDELQPGDRICYFNEPWGLDNTNTAGWIAGMYDGEGCLDSQGHFSLTQVEGVLSDRFMDLMEEKGFDIRVKTSKHGGLGTKSLNRFYLNGGWKKIMEVVGSFRIQRFLHSNFWEGKRIHGKSKSEYAIVQSVKPLGKTRLRAISTSTNTVIADGMFSHNTHLRNQATLMSGEILDNIEITHRKKSRRARCSMDGMGVAKTGRYEGAEFGYELKSANEFAFQNQLVKGVSEKVRKQVDFEFLMTGFDLFVIFNENKNNQDIHEWVIVRDEKRVRKMAKQIDSLNYAIDRGRLHSQLPECHKRLKSGEFYQCPYGGDGGVCASVGTWPSKIGN